MDYNNGRYFSTYDRDNNINGSINCASLSNSLWYGWCSNAFLNDDFRWGRSTYFQRSQMMLHKEPLDIMTIIIRSVFENSHGFSF